MTVTAYPLNYGGSVEYSARQGRQALAALMMAGPGPLRTRSGFRPGGQPTVSVTATTWSVGPFSAIIDTGQSTVTGPYLVASDATESGSVTAAHATFGRIDILYVQVDDTDESDGTGQRRARPLYLAGTASATPSAPATPARSLLIGTIDVPRSGAGSPSWTPADWWTVAAGGVPPARSAATEPPASSRYAGMLMTRTDRDSLYLWGSAGEWKQVYDGRAPAPPWAQAAGQVSWGGTLAAGAAVQAGTVTWPPGRFSATPRVTVSMINAPGGSSTLVARANQVSATSAQVWVYNLGASSATVAANALLIDVLATQMTSGAASG